MSRFGGITVGEDVLFAGFANDGEMGFFVKSDGDAWSFSWCSGVEGCTGGGGGE